LLVERGASYLPLLFNAWRVGHSRPDKLIANDSANPGSERCLGVADGTFHTRWACQLSSTVTSSFSMAFAVVPSVTAADGRPRS
jgi:hypothetical protein